MSWEAATAIIKEMEERRRRRAERIGKIKEAVPWVVGAALLVWYGLYFAGIVKPLYNLDFSNYAGSGYYYDDYMDDWRTR